MPHTRNPEKLSHLPKVTQHQVSWWLGVTSLLMKLKVFGAHDGWVVSFYPGAVKVESLGCLKGPWGSHHEEQDMGEKQRAEVSWWAAGACSPCVFSALLKVTQPRRERGKNGFWDPICPLEQGVLSSSELQGHRGVTGQGWRLPPGP